MFKLEGNMSKHVVYELIEDLGIHDEKSVETRISSLNSNDIDYLLDKMDTWYSKQKIKEKQNCTVLDFWIPTPTENSLYEISSNLLFSNSVILVDPLYDYLCLLSNGSMAQSILKIKSERKEHVCQQCSSALYSLESKILKSKITSVISFYMKSKPLVDDGKLIPHVDLITKVGSFMDDVDSMMNIYEKYDDDVKKFNSVMKRNKEFLNNVGEREGHFVTDTYIPFLEEQIKMNQQKIPVLLSIEQLIKNQSTPAVSIDFLGHISDGFFRGLIKYFNKIAKDELPSNYIAPSIEHYATLPTLVGVPIQHIPEVLDHEKDSLEQFKAYLISSIASISSPLGTQEWYAEIEKIRTNLQKEVIELERTFVHIKKDHLKRQAENIFLLSFSVTLASLALSHQTLDPTSAIQTIASGASLSAGIKNIIDAWLDYQQQVNNQKRRDEYFLWRLQKAK